MKVVKEPSDSGLVEKVIRGDSRAYETIVKKYEKVIFNVAYRMTRDYDDAMDITHILTAAVDFPAQTASEKSKLMAWPEFIQFPAEDKLRGRPTLIVDDVWGYYLDHDWVA